MSTLTMLLVSGMVLGDAPAPVPTDAKEWLCLDGEWEGTLTDDPFVYEARYSNRVLRLTIVGVTLTSDHFLIMDEGMGRLRVLAQKDVRLAIYKRDGPTVVICFGVHGKPRPTSFRTGDGHYLLVLRPVKPRKR